MTKTVFWFFLALSSLAFAAEEPAPNRRIPMEALEKEGDAPMFIFQTGSSPGMISQLGPFTSVQVNVDATGHNIVGDAANECSITMDPTDVTKMAIGWRQFDSVSSNFRKGGYAFTTNGGASWTFPGSLTNGFRSDPVLASDRAGTFFYLSLIPNFLDDIWRSLNGGQSWDQLGPAFGGDKQWFTIDTTNSSGRGFQYQSWSIFGNNFDPNQFTRSTDGGVTWMNPIEIPSHPYHHTLDVDTNGNLFIGGLSGDTGIFTCVRSSDAKNAAVTPTFDQVTPVDLGGTIGLGYSINPAGSVGQAFLAVDRSGTATNNNVYMLASVVSEVGGNGSNIMFSRSTNGGQTFSQPVRINDDAFVPGRWHWFGTLSVARNGRIDVAWYDTRNDPSNRISQLFYSYSADGGGTWSPNIAVSNPFDPAIGYPNQNKIGDYITSVSDGSAANVAYCATFNGEEDIYYVRIIPPGFVPPATPTPSPTPTATATATPTATATATATAAPTATATATASATATPTPTAAPTATATAAPTATATATPTATATSTPIATPTSTPPSQTVNLSTRMRVESGDNVGIGGFIITGSGPKRILLRALGPSLSGLGLPGLPDPILELHAGATVVTNDNWQDDPVQKAEIESSGLAPGNEFESAIVANLNGGSYTAVVRDKTNTPGIAVIEVYDLTQAIPSRLANISTRAPVGTGDNILIAGFTLGNQSGSDTVVVRGIGPSLTNSGVPNPLANPTLELRSANGTLLAANDDWQQDSAQAELANTGLAPSNQAESGLLRTLPPGAYTALLIGASNSSGVGLIEIYDLAH